MRKKLITKGAVAWAAILGLLLVLASPASADTIAHMEITGGTLSAAGFDFDLNPEPDPGNPPPCETPDATVDVDFAPNPPASSGTWTISGGWKAQFQLIESPFFPWYQADFTIVDGDGTWAHTGANTSSLATVNPNNVIFQVEIYQISSSCLKNNLRCRMVVEVVFTGSWTSASTNLPNVVVGDTAVLNGSSVAPHIITSSCNAPFSAFSGQTATITGLDLTTMSTAP